MMEKTEGIVLRVFKHTDTTSIVDLYTKEYGRRTYVVSVPKSKKTKIRYHLLQPLALVSIVSSVRSKSALPRINEITVFYPYMNIPYDPYKSSIAFFLAEFLYRVLKEETRSYVLFDYLLYSFQWLDRAEGKIANYHVVFLMRFSRFIGLYPNVNEYKEGSYFDMVTATFRKAKPTSHGDFLNPLESRILLHVAKLNYETMHRLALNRESRNRCIEVIENYYRIHLPTFPPFKTLSVLKELFD